ncbi:MAG: alkylhydroperoxidase [Lysinibacillus sp.]|nr:alkylhydroperoxidase [Lysinibacillus sp.]
MTYYKKNNRLLMKNLRELAPELFKSFSQFHGQVFRQGALSKKEKEIIAVAIAHVTECPYCIDVHTKKAKLLGATITELIEAVFVVSTIQASGVLQRMNDEKGKDISKFHEDTMKDGVLSQYLKELIAVAVSHAIQCKENIEIHTKKALELGISSEQIDEAILVTAALKAGSSYAHMINLIESYNE